jgi:hypothetical protein
MTIKTTLNFFNTIFRLFFHETGNSNSKSGSKFLKNAGSGLSLLNKALPINIIRYQISGRDGDFNVNKIFVLPRKIVGYV